MRQRVEPTTRRPARPVGAPRARPAATPAARLLELQRQAGNRAVSDLVVQRRTQRRDPSKLSDAELQAELERAGRELVGTDPGDRRWSERFDRSQALHEESERRARAEEDQLRITAAQATMARVVAQTEKLQQRYRRELTWVVETLDSVSAALNGYVGYYNGAHAKFAGVLAAAKQDAERRSAIENVLIGVAIGTGLGLAAGAVFETAKGFAKLAVEAGTEVAEAVLGKSVNVEPPDVFKPPADLDPRLRSDPAAERILQAWRGLALFNFTTLSLGQYQLAVERLAFDLQRDPSTTRVDQMMKLLVEGRAGVLESKLDQLHASVEEFWELSRHPQLKRNELEIEQDLWIRWIQGIRDPDKRADALDEDAIEDHLSAIGVLGDDGRLGVDFGSNTTRWDTDEAGAAAQREGTKLDQIGRYGVLRDDLAPGQVGAVSLRDDLYDKIDKKAPAWLEPSQLHESFPAVAWLDPLRGWQIVQVVGVTASGLEVRAVKNAGGDPVFI